MEDGLKNKKYNSVFNFCFEDDFVPQVPMNSWGYDKCGKTFVSNSEKLIEHLSKNWANIE